MKLGNPKILIYILILIFIFLQPTRSADKIESVPLINLEDLSPTFEEDKDELETNVEEKTTLNKVEKDYLMGQ